MVSFLKPHGTALDLDRVVIGLEWNDRKTNATERIDHPSLDLDAFVFLLNHEEKVCEDEDCIFYGNPKSTCGSVELLGDNLTGGAEGDCEKIRLCLRTIPEYVSSILVVVAIFRGKQRQQYFDHIDACLKIKKGEEELEVARVNISDRIPNDASETCLRESNAIVCGKFLRVGSTWKFCVLARPILGDFNDLARGYGLDVEDEYGNYIEGDEGVFQG